MSSGPPCIASTIASAIRLCSRHNSTANSIFPVNKARDKNPAPESSTQISKGSCNFASASVLAAIASKVSLLVSKSAMSSVICKNQNCN